MHNKIVRATKTGLERFKKIIMGYLMGKLAQLDGRLTHTQRKWVFYLGLLCCSGFLFYLLGTAVRGPDASNQQFLLLTDSAFYKAEMRFKAEVHADSSARASGHGNKDPGGQYHIVQQERWQ